MNLVICTPEKKLFTGTISGICLPGAMGSFSIFPRHAPLVSTLLPGIIVYNTNEGEKRFPIESGVVIVADNKIDVFVDAVPKEAK